MDGAKIRTVLLTVIHERSRQGMFQTGPILHDAEERLGISRDLVSQQALLTFWHDLVRTGYIAWGYNTDNPDPPFCHLTEQGRTALAHLSRDPMNRDGYLAYLAEHVTLHNVPQSYITEALETYRASCYKATAVMVGCAAESIVLRLRDTLVDRLKELGTPPPKSLNDRNIKQVLEAIRNVLEAKKKAMPWTLGEAFESHWSSFTGQIRITRNEAGHPSSVEVITPEQVHASLLIFPELAKLTCDLDAWIQKDMAI